jgi:hypothetical protein
MPRGVRKLLLRGIDPASLMNTKRSVNGRQGGKIEQPLVLSHLSLHSCIIQSALIRSDAFKSADSLVQKSLSACCRSLKSGHIDANFVQNFLE